MERHITVVLTHPYAESFAHATYQTIRNVLEERGQSWTGIDLWADGFDPRYSPEELRLFREGDTTDPLVTRYQEILERTSDLVFVFPVWWNDVPATCKGFIDKVMKQQWAYLPTPAGVKGKLGHIKTVTVLTTSTGPTWYQRLVCGNPIGKVFVGTTLRQLGIKRRRWVNLGRISDRSEKARSRRERHLVRIQRIAMGLTNE